MIGGPGTHLDITLVGSTEVLLTRSKMSLGQSSQFGETFSALSPPNAASTYVFVHLVSREVPRWQDMPSISAVRLHTCTYIEECLLRYNFVAEGR